MKSTSNTCAIFLGGLLVLNSLLTGCTSGSSATPREPKPNANSSAAARRPIIVRTFDVQPSPNSPGGDLLVPASLSVENTALVLAEREGHVVSLNGREGVAVKQGDTLAQFNDDDQRSQIRQAELEVKRLQVEEQQYDALVKLNRSELQREFALAKEGVSSQSDVERARYKLDQATHEYEKTRLATDSARARAQAARIEAEKSIVRAPISGVVIHRYVALGNNVAKNEKLFEVSKLSPLQLKFQIPQTEKNRLNAGQTVGLSLTSDDRVVARARIRRVDPVADATSNTFGYLADIIDGPSLMPGLAVNVHLPRSPEGTVFWLPRAVFPVGTDLHNGASCSLFIVEKEKAVGRSVVISALEGDQVAVSSGIEKNDRVILVPPSELQDGDMVEANPN
jgi:RND family efflux transporter MFP subunit